jgi:hypothetical protein
MERLKSLSRGTKLVLVAGPLLFVSLFLTWQMVEVDFGPAGRADYPLDGWDVWGLQIGLLVIGLVSLVVVFHLTDVKLPDDIPWNTVMFVAGNAVFVLAVVKNVTDAGSTWTSYVFVLLAALVAVGTYLNWSEARTSEPPVVGYGRRGRGLSPTA